MVTLIIVTTVFYSPFHVGPPVMLALLYGRGAAQKKQYAQHVLIESVLTMVVSLTAFFMLWESRLGIAISIMLVMMAVPYIRVWKYRKESLNSL